MEAEGVEFVCNTEVGKRLSRRETARGFRRRRPLHRRHQAARSAHRGPRARRASISPWISSPPTPGRSSTARPTAASSPPRTGTSSSSAAATPAPTASAPPCATAAAASSRSRFCRSPRSIAPPTIPGPNGPRSTRWITARKKPPRNSAPIRASISPPPPSSTATTTAM